MKKLALMLVVILSLGLVAAHVDFEDDYVFKEKISDTKYYPNKNKVVTKTTYIDYDNDKRLPTRDYKYGYTYRSTTEYRDSYKVKRDYSRKYYLDSRRKYSDWDEGKIYYYKDVPHMKGFVKKSCYDYVPSNKLFYIKC